jgi:uncharacterized membrane protein YfcA
MLATDNFKIDSYAADRCRQTAARTCRKRKRTRVPQGEDFVDPIELVVVGLAILVSAYVQGVSGIGFSLIAAPAISLIIAGPEAIGLVNLLALTQNSWHIAREKGVVHWPVLGRLGPGLALGVALGFGLVVLVPDTWRPALVALSSIGAFAALLWWKPRAGWISASLAGTWGGTTNTFAGVGGPPLALFLIKQGWAHADYVRTQMVVFALLNIVSLPLLGLPSIPVWEYASAIGLVILGSASGLASRRFISESTASKMARWLIAVVAITALVRALATLN